MPPRARMPASAIASSSPVVTPGRTAAMSSLNTAAVILPLRRIVSISRADLRVIMLVSVRHADDVQQLMRDRIDRREPVDFDQFPGFGVVLDQRFGLGFVDVQT